MLLQIADLTKRDGHLTALSEVSFSVRPGEVLGLIGPNGSGKTTLFECLGGVLPADGGRVLLNGRALSSALFVEGRGKHAGRTLLLRLEGFNLFNHGNYLGRGQTTYGDTATVNETFGQLASVGNTASAIPAFANVDPPRMFQFQVRYTF